MTPKEVAEHLRERAEELAGFQVVTGFDGFVDEMISVVGQRKNLTDYDRVETIDNFGDRIKAAAGQSSLQEIVVSRKDPGGCAVNMGDGLAEFGVQVETFATVGEPVHAAFAEYQSKVRLHSWGREPGRTLAFEFADGKLMFSAVTPLADFTPAYVAERLKEGEFQRACAGADLIAFTDWTLYPHMTDCWTFLQNEVLSALDPCPRLFLDLVDPVSRSEGDISTMLASLSGFERCGKTTLGLNQNEANIVSRLSGGSTADGKNPEATAAQAQRLRKTLGIDEVVIHAHRYAALSTPEDTAVADGPYCEKPVKSTGAGDRFNAGLALGMLLQLPAVGRLNLANASSGLYVRKGLSPGLTELILFLESV